MTEAGGKILDSVKALILQELAEIKKTLAVINTRLDGLEKRFDDLRQDQNLRLAEFRDDINKRLADFRDDIDKRVEEFRSDQNQRWSEFRSDMTRHFETSRREVQVRLDASSAQIAAAVARLTRMEEDLREIKNDMGYQKIIIQEQQRAVEELRAHFAAHQTRLEVLEREMTKKPRAVSTKKTIAS